MPPKGARGRGRGRGGVGTAASRAPPPPAAATDTPTTESSSSQSAAQTTTTPQNELQSPNSSPATIPTETPAPTPVRVPSQRATGPKPPTGPSKFKPKAVRRGQAERDELARLEYERVKKVEENRENREKKAAFALGGRGGKAGRGRGDTMGKRFVAGRGNGGSEGMFSTLPGALEHGMRPMERENIPGSTNYGSTGPATSDFLKTEGGMSAGGGGGGGGGGGSGGGGGGGARDSKSKYFEPRYPDQEYDDSPRVDIEDINKNYESDNEVVVTGSRKIDRKGKGSAATGGLKPVRLHREEHKERVTIVNTAPEPPSGIKKDPDPVTISDDSDVPMVDEERSGQPNAPRVKSEPVEEITLPGPPPSPDSKRKTKGKEPASALLDSPKKPKHKPAAVKKKDEKPVLQTDEDRAEYERHLLDVQVLAEELGGMQARVQQSGDVAMSGVEADAGGVDKKDGRLYLFQLPGVLTKLYNPATKQKKPKDTASEKDKDVEVVSSTNKPTPVKVEEGGEVIIKQEEDTSHVNDEPVDEIGAVGKMIVRKSGRVEIQWGDTDMLVQRGTDTGFLGAGYVIDGVGAVAGEREQRGVGTGMGMVMGKFVVVPDFERNW